MTKPDGINILTDTASLIAINGETLSRNHLKENQTTGTTQ